MKRERNWKVNAVATYVLKPRGPEHSGLFLEIMKDMKQLISVHSRVIILAVMAAVGNSFCFSS